MSEPSELYTDVITSDRVARRTIAERRRRVLRNVATVFVITVLMVVLLVMSRDQQAINSCHGRMAFATAALQDMLGAGAVSPAELPLSDRGGDPNPQSAPRANTHYFYDAFHSSRGEVGREIGVACCRFAHSQLFRPNGRYVLSYDGAARKYQYRWMSEVEFARLAPELGLRLPDGP